MPCGPTREGSRVPEYYWLDQDRQNLRYHCNFWFLLGSLQPVDPGLLSDVEDLGTGERVTLATQVLYPALVRFPVDGVAAPARESAVPESATAAWSASEQRLSHELLDVFAPTVRFTAEALKELAKSDQTTRRQVIKLVQKLAEHRGPLETVGERSGRPAGPGHEDLWEFYVTGAGRVAIGDWGAGRRLVVGLTAQHPTEKFWKAMAGRWKSERGRV